ncbi:hypothetical protein ES288_D11G254100v1 [Gossypium darwinii]|uniref:Uncharacterized protein n=1 Tax=Gossypium darwinii TaxID=34276 RepID=A0A5D2AQV5_GOSDA|nr:hypothetical protein ES288_D11G254100v1 [Gossypium darwinii]
MQMSQKHKITGKCIDWPSLEPYQSSSDDGSNSVQHSVPNLERYCTLDSSSSMQNSSSTASFSPDGSPVSQQNYTYPLDLHHSPENTCATLASGSCVIDNENDLGLMVRQ